MFEYKGNIDKLNKTYTVYSKSENELYYLLVKLGTKDIEILNNDFKKVYKNYLENQFKSSFLLKKYWQTSWQSAKKCYNLN